MILQVPASGTSITPEELDQIGRIINDLQSRRIVPFDLHSCATNIPFEDFGAIESDSDGEVFVDDGVGAGVEGDVRD